MSRRRQDSKASARVRCAIYTRKSTEEGLDQSFNSLDAQREACEAFILSQHSEGWALLSEAYDDGGLSGGTLERPALQRLLGDMQDGQIDIVVVYKVDRLTRSLADFSKLVETFDAAGASFVSVTQAFNTSTSMGRLTLNMLLSFAQFEREVTAERIRDKIAASRAKGLWMGGPVPLGYDAKDKRLVVNEMEAERVRHIFAGYLKTCSVRELAADLARAGIRSKRRRTKAGSAYGDRPFTRGALIALLRNPVYIGEVRHRDRRFPGGHEAIVDRDVWEDVQRRLEAQARTRRIRGNATKPSLLSGMLFDPAGRPLTPSHASKRGVRYRYYISNSLVTGIASDDPSGWRLPAEPVETAASQALSELLQESATLAMMTSPDGSAAEHQHIRERLESLAARAANKTGGAKRERLLAIDARFEMWDDSLSASISPSLLAEAIGVSAPTAVDRLTGSVPLSIRKRGQETRIVLGDVRIRKPDADLTRLIKDSAAWFERLLSGEVASVRALARDLGRDHRAIARTLPLAFLAPDIRKAILDGTQPTEMTPSTLLRLGSLPLDWQEQRSVLGVLAKP